jgi:hypothetical protein
MQPAWNHCAPDALNSLQIGGIDLRIVLSGLGEKWGLVGLWGGGRSFLVRTGRGLASGRAFAGPMGDSRDHYQSWDQA